MTNLSATRKAKIGLTWVFYFLTLSIALGIYFSLLAKGFPVSVATGVSGLFMPIWLTVFEFLFPYRTEWQGLKKDTIDDILYKLLVQIGFARILEKAWHSNPTFIQAVWPTNKVVLLGLMLLIGEFGRYWIHRFCHTMPLLWRFHSIHHSPDRMNWWNTSRFHFVEKAIQMFAESLLFYSLGAPLEAIGAYFVIYSVQGIFQHVNIDLKFGVLNYVVSSVEQHRWHHSIQLDDANHNYGNKLALYDLIFGTYFLPKDREVGKVGVEGISYAPSVFREALAPFRFGKDLPSFYQGLIGHILRYRILWSGKKTWKLYEGFLSQTDFGQLETLKSILENHKNSEFGIKHGFDKVQTAEMYRKALPIMDYENLRPWIEKQDQNRQCVLNHEIPLFYATTSGTTDKPKYIPVTHTAFQHYRESQNLWLYFATRPSSDFLMGRFLGIAGSAVEGHMPSGIPFGSSSGHIYASLPRILKSKYVVPHFVYELPSDLKYLTILRLVLQAQDITWLATANPSTFVQLERVLNENIKALCDDLNTGGFHQLENYPNQHDKLALKDL